MKMHAPLLRDENDDNGSGNSEEAQSASWWRRIINWITWRRGNQQDRVPSNAETVVMLQKVMADLTLYMTHAEEEALKKKRLAAHVWQNGHRDLAIKAMATAHTHSARYKVFFNMRENVEQIKAELIAQQQTASVFGAFSRANDALGRIAQQLNVSNLERVLSELRDKMEAGEEVSLLLASPAELDPTYDEDTLRDELLEYVSTSSPTVSAPALGDSVHDKNFKIFPRQKATEGSFVGVTSQSGEYIKELIAE